MLEEADKNYVIKIVKHYVEIETNKPHIVLGLLKAIVQSLIRLFDIRMWYGVLLFIITYLIGTNLFITITFVVGGVCFLINRIIDVINVVQDVLTLGSAHKIDVKEVDALSGLIDGRCFRFFSPQYTMRYWFARTLGNKLCEELSWYETITLSRWFVAKPMKFFYIQVGTVPGEHCHLTMAWDVCAAVTGTKGILDFLMFEGVWILVALIVFSPIIMRVLKITKRIVYLVTSELHFWLYVVQPRWKKAKRAMISWWHRIGVHQGSPKNLHKVSK